MKEAAGTWDFVAGKQSKLMTQGMTKGGWQSVAGCSHGGKHHTGTRLGGEEEAEEGKERRRGKERCAGGREGETIDR